MKYLLLLLLITACGTDEGATNPSSDDDRTGTKPITLALDSKDLMPDCTDTNQHQLVYIIDEETFYTCVDEWYVIDINGKDGIDGTDAKQIAKNIWTDPITDSVWFIGGLAERTPNPCPSPFVLPTDSQASEAIFNGLIHHLETSPNNMWTSTWAWNVGGVDKYYYYETLHSTPNRTWNDLDSVKKGIYCIRD